MKFICVLIIVSDIKKSKDFYERVLGQKVKYDFGENITFEGDFAIHSKSHFVGLIDGRKIEHGRNNMELYFEYDNIDEIDEKLKNSGVEYIHGVREEPWRHKGLRIYDPDGYIVEVGESLKSLFVRLFKQGMCESEISKLTGVNLENVRANLKEYN